MSERPGATATVRGIEAQLRGWALLDRLHPEAMDLARVELLRTAPLAELVDEAALERLLLRLGLNVEGLDELPETLHGDAGGLRVWQMPIQFAPYLVRLSSLGIRSYLEVGIRHGGSFVATTEYLGRVGALDLAIGVDIIPCPSAEAYRHLNPAARFEWVNSGSPAFTALLDEVSPLDLVFIDSHHELDQCRDELAQLHGRTNAIAMHDIANPGCPGIGQAWAELTRDGRYRCEAFVDQYDPARPTMGIGLAVRRDWMEAPR